MLREFKEIYFQYAKSTTRMAEHDVHNAFEMTLRDMREYGLDDLTEKRVLDLGCGQRYQFALQCAASGAKVTALDIDYVVPDFLPLAFYRSFRHDGLKRAIKSAARRILYDDTYYQALEVCAAKSLRSHMGEIEFVVADPSIPKYPLPSNAFELIVSIAVLEHVEDVTTYAAEVARLLRSGGYFYAIIHNFYSLSGGHNLEWAYPDERPSSRVPPWDHLRENRFPAWTYLNRWRPEEYEQAFADQLQILRFEGVGINHDPGEPEGECFLTERIATELASYPKELITTRAWCMICKKDRL